MTDDKSFLENVISGLKQQRDELALQIHLGKEEAVEEWDKVQAKLDKLSDDYEPLRNAVEESAGNVFESLKLVAGEVKDSFERIAKSITSEKKKKNSAVSGEIRGRQHGVVHQVKTAGNPRVVGQDALECGHHKWGLHQYATAASERKVPWMLKLR